jgi:hypothetical protein
LSLADRVLLVAVYYRTNVIYRQVALLFGISKSAAGRVVDHLVPLLALAPIKRPHGPDTVLIVDGTLVHYSHHRPHRALQQAAPLRSLPPPASPSQFHLRRRDLLGGLIHEYAQVA